MLLTNKEIDMNKNFLMNPDNTKLYDLACDIVVGYVLDGLGYPYGVKSEIDKRKLVYKSINGCFL